MKTIRKNIFETNSSSSHSLSLESNVKLDDNLVADPDGVVRIEEGEFGWEWRKYNDAHTKASYCLTLCRYNDLYLDMLRDVIEDYTKHQVEFITDCGYIDHQSSDNDEMFSSRETLKDFIFSTENYLFTGNDNDDPEPNFYDKEGTVYKYKVITNEKVIKFQEFPTEREIFKFIETILPYSEELIENSVDMNDKTFKVILSSRFDITNYDPKNPELWFEYRKKILNNPENWTTKTFEIEEI